MDREYVIITDSTNDMPCEFTKENNIGIVHLLYEIDGETYGAEKQLTMQDFYNKMRAGLPTKTAASNIDEISNFFEEQVKQQKDILFMCLSSGISSTFNNAMASKQEVEEMYPECRIFVIDSLCASCGLGMLLYRAVENKKNGMSLEENYKKLEEEKLNVVHKFTVDKLEYLQRGGRISKTAAAVGTLINLKPLLHVNDEGKLVSEHKIRGRKKSLQQMIQNMGEAMGSWKDKQDVIIVGHADVDEDADYCVELIEKMYNPKKIIKSYVTPTIGAHSGPGTVVVVFMGDIR